MVKLKQLRETKGFSQNELSKRSGVTQSNISRIESGEHSPKIGTLQKLAIALGIDTKDFF